MTTMTLHDIKRALERLDEFDSTETNVTEVVSIVAGGRRRVVFAPAGPDPLRLAHELRRLQSTLRDAPECKEARIAADEIRNLLALLCA